VRLVLHAMARTVFVLIACHGHEQHFQARWLVSHRSGASFGAGRTVRVFEQLERDPT
jgi:hypothetical protein